jgi:hypothetical protein
MPKANRNKIIKTIKQGGFEITGLSNPAEKPLNPESWINDLFPGKELPKKNRCPVQARSED